MKNHLHARFQRQRNLQSGFTLVEMLVAVALVLLMMSLFAEIFSLAIGSMSRQKGVAENDQRARMVLTLLKGDLEKRTFRDLVPFVPGTNTSITPINSALPNRRGYLCYSENNPLDETDDVLRLSIEVNQISQNSDITPLYGRATALGGAAGLQSNPNQPDGDDGEFPTPPALTNNTGMAPSAEVVYFLRGRRLYRRQMLIREPYVSNAGTDPSTGNPPTATPIFGATYSSGSGIFWRDFDYSVFYHRVNNQPRFHDNTSLSNDSTAPAFNLGGGFTVPVSLGVPHLRFGHTTFVTSGVPKEFLGADNGGIANFIGCYTHEETSSPAFVDPGQSTTASTNPHSQTGLSFDTTNTDPSIDPFTVDQFRGGARVGEDLLLANVLSFDIKIWDPGVSLGPDGLAGDGVNTFLRGTTAPGDEDGNGSINDNIERGWKNSDDGDWRDLGHSDLQGYYSRAAGATNANGTTYGNRFDTWHPTTALTDLPPYRASYYYPTGTTAASNRNWRSRDFWAASNPTSVGDVIFPPNAVAAAQGFSFAYRCRAVGAVTQNTGLVAPTSWPTTAGTTIVDGDVLWECVENTIPVKGLQFRIRYLDSSSGLVRDLTLVQYLNVPN